MSGRSQVCLDLTRSVRRLGRGPATGIDRVEQAYLEFLLSQHSRPLLGLVRTKLGYAVLQADALKTLADAFDADTAPQTTDLVSRVLLGEHTHRARAETLVRGLARNRSLAPGLPGLLRRVAPKGAEYVNVGHSNLSQRTLQAWRSHGGSSVSVFVHDTIPLDFPQYQRIGAPEDFRRKLAVVEKFAGKVIVASRAVADTLRQHMEQPPPTLIAPLGVRRANARPVPADIPKPYVLTVGTIEPRKNHALLLDLWGRPDFQECAPSLVVVGARGWRNETTFRKLDELKMTTPGIFEFNALRDDALDGLLRGATALLHPSWAEGFGLPVFEAIAAGVPAIAAPLPVFREQLGERVIYADPDNPYQWREAINRLLTKKAEDVRDRQISNVPTWAEHFAAIFPEIT